mmetsp:Transcript_3334/g.5602  ORF Transcript_3334/g.5602 Transcript_3334/m.5602 type:complete len:108 (+) Transcript_3334:143-466(+)
MSPVEIAAFCHDDSVLVPALSLMWSSCVNTRLVLTKESVTKEEAQRIAVKASSFTSINHELEHTGVAHQIIACRRLHVIFSPRLAPCVCSYELRQEGVCGLDDLWFY